MRAGRRSRDRSLAIAFVVVAALAACGVFALPFLFPPTHQSLSPSYVAGFNNRVSAVAAAFAAVLAFGLAWRLDKPLSGAVPDPAGRISRHLLWAMLAACAVFTGACGWILCQAQVSFNDNLYFVEYMDSVVRYHQHIYRDFPFLYGPVLLYFPIAIYECLRPLHISVEGAYFAALTIWQVLGLGLTYFTLEALPLSRRAKSIVLCIFTVSAICPNLGLNYSLIRSLLPFSTLLFTSRVSNAWKMALAFAAGEVLQLAVSPELGFAFAAGASFYALCLTLQRRRLAWVPAVFSPWVGAAAFIAVTGTRYLQSVSSFSSGAMNMIVEPVPYILIFLFAVIWVVPVSLAGFFRQHRTDAILLAALFVVSLGMLPPALGRCDPLHVFFNGADIYILAAVAAMHWKRETRRLWFTLFAWVAVTMNLNNLFAWNGEFLYSARVVKHMHDSPALARENKVARIAKIDLARLDSIVGTAGVATPFRIPYATSTQLKDSGHFIPDPDVYYIGIWTQDAEQSRAARLDRAEWALVPLEDESIRETPKEEAESIVGFRQYPNRHAEYVYGDILYSDLAENWKPVAMFGDSDLVLYRHQPE